MFVKKSTYEAALSELEATRRNLRDYVAKSSNYEGTLKYIVEQKTAVPNATVTRIVSAAEEALAV
jgi:quinol monooxygenase YgiN